MTITRPEERTMGLFSRSESKNGDAEAARADCARYAAMPTGELAAAILPAFAPDQGRPASGPLMAAEYLVRPYPGAIRARCVRDLRDPVAAAIEALQAAGLLAEHARGGGASGKLQITAAGRAAIDAGRPVSAIVSSSSRSTDPVGGMRDEL
jgi:hypothetical protein